MMNVRELIDHLWGLDMDAPVYTITTCECCTDFELLTVGDINERDVSDVQNWASYQYARAPLRSDWKIPALVISGGGWSTQPSDEEILRARKREMSDDQ